MNDTDFSSDTVNHGIATAIRYQPESGELIWVAPTASRFLPGDLAGSYRKDGYCRVRINKRDYLAHRVAWLLMTGAWPFGEVDHIDGDPSNNRWSNLRDVSPTCNQQNRRRALRKNTTGLLGASYDTARAKYVAQISVNGARVWLGYHSTAQAAHESYIAAKRQLHEGGTL